MRKRHWLTGAGEMRDGESEAFRVADLALRKEKTVFLEERGVFERERKGVR